MDLTKKTDNNTQEIESTRGYIYRTPETDIYEDKDNYKIIFDIPGIEKEDVTIKVEKDVLTLTAESRKKPEEDFECVREEMVFAGYQRAFNLNGIVDSGKIEADYNNGTLTLTLPKKEEEKTKEIQIKIA